MKKRTKDELDRLKREWERNPIWFLEDTEGFAAHYGELLVHRMECEVKCSEKKWDDIESLSESLGCSTELAAYIIGLESRIEKMTELIQSH